MDHTLDIFNEQRFSDLTIKLSNGTLIYAHKLILCRGNKYFDMLCGPDSQFAESKQAIIELQEDDPAALGALLFWIYNGLIEDYASSSDDWRFWLSLRSTADKYLEPRLRAKAHHEFVKSALALRDVDEIFDVIDAIEREMSHDETLVQLAEELKDANFLELLENKRFRAKIGDGEEAAAVWEQVDKFLSTVKRDKRRFLCRPHDYQVYGENCDPRSCPLCASKGKLAKAPKYSKYGSL